MPITEDEWDQGEVETRGTSPHTKPVSEHETEKDLVVAFLGENVDNAYTKAEIVKGVDFAAEDDPGTVRRGLESVGDGFLDAVGSVVASGMVVDDIDEALDELVAEGVVERKEVRDGDETRAYYRMAGDTT